MDSTYSFKTKNLYTLLLCLQIFDIVNFMIISELVEKGFIAISSGIQMAIQFAVVLVTNIIMTVFVNRFIKRKVWVYVYVLAVVLSLILAFGAGGPLKEKLTLEQIKVMGLMGFGFAALSNSFIATLALKDVFSQKHELSYSLIGASWIFLLFGIVFANAYMFLGALSPTLLVTSENANAVVNCLRYSFYIISGQDPPFANVDMVIRNVSTFESIFSNLYGLMVVGRLLTK